MIWTDSTCASIGMLPTGGSSVSAARFSFEFTTIGGSIAARRGFPPFVPVDRSGPNSSRPARGATFSMVAVLLPDGSRKDYPDASTPLDVAVARLRDDDGALLPVAEDGRLVGIFTERDAVSRVHCGMDCQTGQAEAREDQGIHGR